MWYHWVGIGDHASQILKEPVHLSQAGVNVEKLGHTNDGGLANVRILVLNSKAEKINQEEKKDSTMSSTTSEFSKMGAPRECESDLQTLGQGLANVINDLVHTNTTHGADGQCADQRVDIFTILRCTGVGEMGKEDPSIRRRAEQ